MMRYALLNLVVLAVLLIFSWLLVRRNLVSKRYGYTLAALVGMTAVFDSLIIAMGIVGYNNAHILGVYIGRAPLEDFAYAIAAALLVPALWEYYDRR